MPLRLLPAMLLLTVAACGRDPEPALGGVSADEAAALNNAAEMLDNRSLIETGEATENAGE